MIKLAPSLLSANFARLEDEIKKVERGGADWLHVDVMDGHFVPNITIGPPVVRSIRKVSALPLDVHLMIENADRYLEDFAAAGADIITVHWEGCNHIHRSVTRIKELGKKAGISLNPATPADVLKYMLAEVDLVLCHELNPGFGDKGSSPRLEKIEPNKRLKKRAGTALNRVDGGVTADNAQKLVRPGRRSGGGLGVYDTPSTELACAA